MEEPLIVIDMQDTFISRRRSAGYSHYNSVIDAVTKQCRLAMKRRDPIVFVEYDSYTALMRPYSRFPNEYKPTLSELRRVTNVYGKRYFAFKDRPDGSKPIAKLFQKEKLPGSNIRICGVYTLACVISTLDGLLKTLPQSKFKVIRAACGELYPCDAPKERSHIKDLIKLDPKRIKAIGPFTW